MLRVARELGSLLLLGVEWGKAIEVVVEGLDDEVVDRSVPLARYFEGTLMQFLWEPNGACDAVALSFRSSHGVIQACGPLGFASFR